MGVDPGYRVEGACGSGFVDHGLQGGFRVPKPVQTIVLLNLGVNMGFLSAWGKINLKTTLHFKRCAASYHFECFREVMLGP